MSEPNPVAVVFVGLFLTIYKIARDFFVGAGVAMLLRMPRDACIKTGAACGAITFFVLMLRGAAAYGRNTTGD